jgi:hypothetical protein
MALVATLVAGLLFAFMSAVWTYFADEKVYAAYTAWVDRNDINGTGTFK